MTAKLKYYYPIKYDKKYKILFYTILMKQAISATIDKKLVDWIELKLRGNSLTYRNKSHLIEVALQLLKQEEEKKG